MEEGPDKKKPDLKVVGGKDVPSTNTLEELSKESREKEKIDPQTMLDALRSMTGGNKVDRKSRTHNEDSENRAPKKGEETG